MTSRADLLQFAITLADEREQAREIVASLRERLKDVWDQPLREEWKTLGVARELIAASDATLERNPPEAKELAQMAVAVVTSIPDNRYPNVARAQVEGQAFRVLGIANRYMYQHEAALRAFDAAEHAFERDPALGHDRATLILARAIAFSAMNRHDEAVAHLDRAAVELAEYGDRSRIVQCTVVRGSISHRRGEFAEARRSFEEALAVAKSSDDLHTLAVCYGNVGHTCLYLRDFPAAIDALQHARGILSTLEMTAEVVRTDWQLGQVLLAQQEYGKAIGILRSIRERFMEWRMVDEGGLVALDLVEALTATGDLRSAIALTETVIVDFRTAGLSERALTALAYLRELLPSHAAPQRPIQHVRSYLEKLREEPAQMFLPLPE